MSGSSQDALPRIAPPDGAPVSSGAPVLAGAPVAWEATELAPPALQGSVLTWHVAEGIEVLEAKVGLSGSREVVDLLDSSPAPEIGGGAAQVDFGAPRPFTKIAFEPASPAKLMIQLGGTWFLPQPAGQVADFSQYPSATAFPELVAQKILLSGVTGVTQVESRSFPANVALRLGDGGVPFFFHRGDLHESEVPDLAEPLAVALSGCEPVAGVCTVDLIARSEAFGKIAASVARVSFRAAHDSLHGLTFEERTRMLLPGAGPPATFDLPVPPGLTLPADRPAVAAVDLGLAALGLGPAFAPTGGRRGAVVSERFQVAQPVPCEDALTVAAVHLYLLRRTARATLGLELREDAGGEPRGAVLASASAPVSDLPEGAFQWLRVSFDEPVTAAAGSRLWIVLEAADGKVEWRGDEVPADGAAALFSTDLGNAWEPHRLASSFILETSLAGLASPPAITIGAGGETQTVAYDPEALPILLGGDSPLVQGLNEVIATATGGVAGAPLPAEISLALESDAPLPVQITLTRLDVTYTQVLTVAPA